MANGKDISLGRVLLELGALLSDVRGRMANPVGVIRAHLASLSEIKPRIAGLDFLPFEATIATNGTVTQPATVRVAPDYYTEIFGVFGYYQDPANDFDQITGITAKFREAGRGFDVFDHDLAIAGLVNNTGVGPTREFPRGSYVFQPGGEVVGTFSTSSVTLASQKKVGVVLMVNKVFRGE